MLQVSEGRASWLSLTKGSTKAAAWCNLTRLPTLGCTTPCLLRLALQVACILGAALVLFTSRSEGEGGGSYDAF